MDKNRVNEIITEFMEKIFGFALTKTLNTERAEELASRITFDVYKSLLKADEVHNISGYIYRIAHNVYARFVDEEVRGRYVSLDNVHIPALGDFTLDIEKDEIYRHLRRRVSYLGKIQREIVVMFYFDGLKQNEIAKRLSLPSGTVKWHLHEARNQLKGGIQMSAKTDLRPIKFAGMAHSGSTSPDGKETSFYLSKLIAQNIVYSTYWQPRTITEIAESLGVQAAFIEDEVAVLEEFSFLEKLAGGKYQSTVYIHNSSNEIEERSHELFKKYAKIVCEKYVPLVFKCMEDYKTKGIYSPLDDFNFLMYTAITFACFHKFYYKDNLHDSKYKIKRKDGGDYIAMAYLPGDNKKPLSFNHQVYSTSNNMTRGHDNPYIQAWQVKTYYDSRNYDYMDNWTEDYCWLYEFITGKLTKEPTHADEYKRLIDKGYIASGNGEEYANMVIAAKSYGDFHEMIPIPPAEFQQLGEELDRMLYDLYKDQYPPHMQEVCRLWNSNSFSSMLMPAYVLTQLVDDGILKPLTNAQKASVNTIMFCDVLPKAL